MLLPFVPGLQSSKGFFVDVVEPLILRRFPSLRYAAGLLGHCSDVLGFDDPVSTDHVWGPRMQLFLSAADHGHLAKALDQTLSMELPPTYQGWPVNYRSDAWFRWVKPEYRAEPPFNHFIEITTVQEFFNRDIRWDTSREPTLQEWLTFTDQALVELTSGQVFRDDLGDLTRARECLRVFPDSVWLFRMFCLWKSIYEEQAFAGRCHQVGDPLGWLLIRARIINKVIKICFHLERKYFPYSKWFGTAFQRLDCASGLRPLLRKALLEPDYKACESVLCDILRQVLERHNGVGVTPPVTAYVIDCYERGFHCLDVEPVCNALNERLQETSLKGMNWGLLSKIVLYDDSNFGNSSHLNSILVDAAQPLENGLAGQ